MSPNSTCDLHLHTYYSDGRASPSEVLHYAASIGLRTISITDHDNMNGLPEAAYVAEELGLELIPGIELTARWDELYSPEEAPPASGDIDILGYFIEPENDEFQAFTRAALDDLKERITECCTLLTKSGYPISIFDVLDENPRYPGAVPLISALQHRGYASSWQAAFPLFMQHWRAVRLPSLMIEPIIAAIHAAGGVAVLAHPVSVSCSEGWLQTTHIARLVDMGLDGLEVFHPRLNPEARAHFLDLSEQFSLLVTGGSDEHGWSGGFVRMGCEPLSYRMVQRLRERSQEARGS